MKPLLTLAVAGAISAIATLPVQAQSTSSPPSTMQGQSSDQNAPGSGGVSKPGISGAPGSKAGPAAKGGNASDTGVSGSSTAPQQDQSKVPGLPGGKSGATEKSPRSSTSGTNDKE
jgi:hypothetical protein